MVHSSPQHTLHRYCLPLSPPHSNHNNFNALSSAALNDTELTETEELLRDQEASLADLLAERAVRETALRLLEEAALKKAAKTAGKKPLSANAPDYTPKTRAGSSPFPSPPGVSGQGA